jgi:hypothetical protein
MRWKLIRRRLSVNAPRMIVRSHLPWPVRWALIALVLGFSASLALWAFEFGKDIAGLDRDAKAELGKLRIDVASLQSEREKALSVANTAEGLLKAEKVAQEKLAQQLRQTESENLSLKNDLGFYERLLPTALAEGLAVRGLQAQIEAPGRVKYLMLLMQAGKTLPEFHGRCEVSLAGTLDGRPWSVSAPGGPQSIQLKQTLRVEGLVDHPEQAVVKTLSVKVTDSSGVVKATATVKL